MNQKKEKSNLRWSSSQPTYQNGVITGCDQKMEWILKWFWRHYSATNSLPITFLDFGVSKSARLWCEKHMHVISCPIPKQFEEEPLSFSLPKEWSDAQKERRLIERKFWFTKVCSLLKTPYLRSLWVDIDCKFLDRVDSIFEFCDHASGTALSLDSEQTISYWKKWGLYKPGAKGYHAGIILFKKRSPLIEKWALSCQKEHTMEYGEQTLLNSLIERENITVPLLPDKCHWIYPNNVPKGVKIVHYGGEEAKNMILREMENA